ncbi:EpsG family protein [Sphingomonas edaphi]|uniref:EpsG family protein n=1 Tax=Sphingomonas edaphi TaxID=2315689 RepID=A0A418PY65_9SPHN|nr:EpsG family protein [Sphingomonas edaphi]RIX27016.1 hypothetical protein D3M59_10695 [Sphingomonas edaphi]
MLMRDFYLSGYLPSALVTLGALFALGHLVLGSDRAVMGRAWGGLSLVVFLILLIGLRPISGLYVDMTTYATAFEWAKWDIAKVSLGDPLFDLFTNFSSTVVSVETYFFICAVLYVIPKAWAARLWFGPRWPIAMAAMATSFSFYGFGVNGIRNGIAASICLLALASPKLSQRLLFGTAAVLTHISTGLTLVSYAITARFNSVRGWMLFWFAMIPLSLVTPSALFSRIIELNFDRRTAYFDTVGAVGGTFRWDFIVYSGVGVAAIAYWKFVRRVVDPEFDRLASTYLIANGFWVLINQVSYSNRFAYLSWFLLEIVVLFPLLRQRLTRESFLPVIALILANAAIFFAVVE